MTKAEIVQALYSKVGGFSRKESAELVDLVFEMMKETLGRGEKIKVSGFGNFVLRDKRQRPGRNPQTGQPIKISERRVLTFKASQILKQALNQRSGQVSNGSGTTLAAAGSGDSTATEGLSRSPCHERRSTRASREPAAEALLPHRRGGRARRRRAARASLLGARVPQHPPDQERQGPARVLAPRRREPDARAASCSTARASPSRARRRSCSARASSRSETRDATVERVARADASKTREQLARDARARSRRSSPSSGLRAADASTECGRRRCAPAESNGRAYARAKK